MASPSDLNSILQSLKIKAECVDHRRVRNVSLFDLKLTGLGKVKDIEKYTNEISLALKAQTKALVKVIPSAGVVRLEICEGQPEKVSLFDGIDRGTKEQLALPMFLGSTIDGIDSWLDLKECPHVLIAGTTGSGKSVALHSFIGNSLRLLDTSLCLIDTKRVEFEPYNILPNVSIANDYSEALNMLKAIYREMEYRYKCMATESSKEFGNVILIIDELADLVLQQDSHEFSQLLCRVLQKSRAAKIYVIAATQRPSVDIVNGAIKANLPCRIGFKTATSVDSRVVLDQVGAQSLAGKGDAIVKSYMHEYVRMQAAYTTSEEVIDRYSNLAFHLVNK